MDNLKKETKKRKDLDNEKENLPKKRKLVNDDNEYIKCCNCDQDIKLYNNLIPSRNVELFDLKNKEEIKLIIEYYPTFTIIKNHFNKKIFYCMNHKIVIPDTFENNNKTNCFECEEKIEPKYQFIIFIISKNGKVGIVHSNSLTIGSYDGQYIKCHTDELTIDLLKKIFQRNILFSRYFLKTIEIMYNVDLGIKFKNEGNLLKLSTEKRKKIFKKISKNRKE